ncbi:acetyltransferase [Sphingopyxis sp. H038]|jgi:ribosomal-protein-alanine N-acetyltransferase|uniref:GNAT family N-acetyltransferase n=1 Tax=unclassified Sphingopyxis TaxID=2614943 RepID=UPI0007310AE3|nr:MULTISPECIES: GNAT family N-acetyltransferase [unclassified Sphingopyxis]KTE03462.1 acetyltransferase [Sphingopyxis sp. H012]KTE07968.1 acetyltransferase [Sphingopyxis sp. H053]KTE13932.1 acetyltransferase [Sphingopyxis sp. H093]KTE23510.1 acetyltransferase [Sphingopyxis sp. H080]KTE34246.1 acetyltransferase [Sphingopyxis sp. H038]
MTSPFPDLTTETLLLRPLVLEDHSAIQAIFPQWQIVRHLNPFVPWPYPDDGALTFVRDVALPAMREGKAWHWSIRTRQEPGTLIGVISLMLNPDDNRGFWLDPVHWGKGLMREASDAVTDYWFDVLDQPILRVPKAIDNRASRAISTGSGMRVVWRGEKQYVEGALPSELWEITADEWRARRILRPDQ